jgi:glycosyltransferase involved in cell wall biosynthesis
MNAVPSPPKRLLFLTTEVFANGGIQRFNQTMIAAYGGCHVTCRVLSLNDGRGRSTTAASYANTTVTGFSGRRALFALGVARALWASHFDWVLIGHINLLGLVVAALTLKLFKRDTPIVLIAHGIEVWTGVGRLRRFALSRTRKILCVSRYTRQRILDQAPRILPERLIVYPNALAETWRTTTRDEPLQRMPDRFILSVTRLEKGDRYKGIVTVIEALSMLNDDGMHYCIVGRGDDLSFLQQVAVRCGVRHRVHFMRDAKDAELIAYYEQCAAFVLPSGNEGFGIVFLEAMYFGAPVIAARKKGALDVIRDEETGLLVRFGDCIAVKNAIERLESDFGLRERLRAAARATVVERGPFTFAHFTERCADVFELQRAQAI